MRVERLAPHHDIASFSCGVKELDDWLRGHALENQSRNLSRTFVLVDDDSQIVGYYALSGGGVRREQLPKRFGRGLPAYEIGLALIARLAIVAGRQGEGLGRDLMVSAIEHAAFGGEHVAFRFIAVDPIDESARSSYSRFDFVDVPGDSGGRMYLRIDEALASISDQ